MDDRLSIFNHSAEVYHNNLMQCRKITICILSGTSNKYITSAENIKSSDVIYINEATHLMHQSGITRLQFTYLMNFFQEIVPYIILTNNYFAKSKNTFNFRLFYLITVHICRYRREDITRVSLEGESRESGVRSLGQIGNQTLIFFISITFIFLLSLLSLFYFLLFY